MRYFPVLSAAFSLFSFSVYAAPDSLSTVAEQSGWTRTARFDETLTLCHRFEQKFRGKARCSIFGKTPEGRPMVALVASEDGALTPQLAQHKARTVVLVQGAIHAGECDGKDAGFFVLRELLEGRMLPGVLKKLTFVFVPVFNIDGHERFGPNHRPNQRGPEEMGWRTTAQNFNLNRDYMKAETPEMAAMLKLLGEWDPILYLDLHVTDGADFQHQIAVIVDPRLEGPLGLRKAGAQLSSNLMEMLARQNHLPLPFYPDFRDTDNPNSGFDAGVSPPRFSESYWGLRNRLGVLVETHSWKDYTTRVRATIDTLKDSLELAARDGAYWIRQARAADLESQGLAGKSLALNYENTERSHLIDFLGYAYKRENSEVSGSLMTKYDPTHPETMKLPLRDEIRPKVSIVAPLHGYFIPAAYAGWLAPKLKLHEVAFERRVEGSLLEVETFRATGQPEFGKQSYEGRQSLKIQGEWKPERREITAGSLFVPISQSRALLAMQLLEPEGVDSFLSWGFFNSSFERKEYMEPYVAEQVARAMMLRDPGLTAEFEKKLSTDAAFAKDPALRLDFFYQKHPSWDERYGLYPVYRN